MIRQIPSHLSFLVAAAMLALAMCLGGSSYPYFWPDLIVQLSAAGALIYIILSGGLRKVSGLPLHLRILLLVILLLPVVQLIPLPPAVAGHLPGQQLVSQIVAEAGGMARWRPMTIDPDVTRAALLALLAPCAAFLLTLNLPRKQVSAFLWLMLALILISAIIGVFQVASRGTMFGLYENFYAGYSSGLLANRNHQADLLAIGILLLAYLAMNSDRKPATLGIFAVMGGILMVSIIATASRMGLLLGGVTIAGCVAYYVRLSIRTMLIALLVAAAIGAILMMSSTVQGAFARFGDISGDSRAAIWGTSLQVAGHYFPLGSGLGTFTQAFTPFEPLVSIDPAAVNAAHNDYIELIMAAGVLAIMVIIWMLVAIIKMVRIFFSRRHSKVEERMFLLCLGSLTILLLHSLVDYPLQTQAMSFIFGAFLALMMRVSYPETEISAGSGGYRASATANHVA